MSRIRSSYTLVTGAVDNWHRADAVVTGRVYNRGKCLAVVMPRWSIDKRIGRAGIGRKELLQSMADQTPSDSEFMQLELIGRWLLENLEKKAPRMVEKTEWGDIRQTVVFIRKDTQSWRYEGDRSVSKDMRLDPLRGFDDLESLVADLARRLEIQPIKLPANSGEHSRLPRLPKAQLLASRTIELITAMSPAITG